MRLRVAPPEEDEMIFENKESNINLVYNSVALDCVDVYIPKNHIVAVRKFETCSSHFYTDSIFTNAGATGFPDVTKEMFQIWHKQMCSDHLYNDDQECPCGLDKEKNVEEDCLFVKEMFPLYEVVVENKMRLTVCGDKTTFKTFTYLLDPSEREHMERYLAGTDDPMYDFVHELRYNPNRAFPASPELEKVKSDFENNKKRKTA